MTRHVIGACAALALLASAGAASAAQGSFELSPIGVPLGTDKVVMEVTITVKGKLVTRTITIPKGDIKPVAAVNCAGLTNAQCEQAKIDAAEKASQDKAKVFADAINKAFETEFKAMKKSASTGLKVGKTRISVGGVAKTVDATLGAIIIPSVTEKQGNPIKITEGRILGEGGNVGNYIKPPPTSPGGKASLERATPGTATVSTGVDPLGDPSYVQFGIQEIYVAEVDPTAGQTDDEVLMGLASDLNSHGLPAIFDPGTDTLSFQGLVPNGDSVVWSNTDAGLEFQTEISATTTVPEPGTWMLLLAGLGGAGAMLRARRRAQPLTSRY